MLEDADLKKKQQEKLIDIILKFFAKSQENAKFILQQLNITLDEDELNFFIEAAKFKAKVKEAYSQLKLKDLSTLQELYESLKFKTNSAVFLMHNYNQAVPYSRNDGLSEENIPFGPLKPLVAIFKNLFDPSNGFLSYIMTSINQIRISLNPETKLIGEEIQKYAHSDLFIEAGEHHKKFNRIYRYCVYHGYSEQQTLYQFFNSIRDQNVIKDNQQRHRLFKMAERKLLKGKKFADPSMPDDIANKVYANLTALSRFTFMPHATEEEYNQYEVKIKNVRSIVSNLVCKIQKQETDLKEKCKQEYISKEEKLALYSLIQKNKHKLYHFMLKIEAWNENQTLCPEKEFNYSYICDQFRKFPSSIDYTDNHFEFSDEDANYKNKGIYGLVENDSLDSNLRNQISYQQSLIKIQKDQINAIQKVIKKAKDMLHSINEIIIQQEANCSQLQRNLKFLNREPDSDDNLDSRLNSAKSMIDGLNIDLEATERSISTTDSIYGVDSKFQIIKGLREKSNKLADRFNQVKQGLLKNNTNMHSSSSRVATSTPTASAPVPSPSGG